MNTGRFIVFRKSSEFKESKEYCELEIISVTNKFIHLKFISSGYDRWLTKEEFDKEFLIEEELVDSIYFETLEKLTQARIEKFKL